VRAHPTDEHLLPLFVALGAAAEQAKFSAPYHATMLGALSMDAYMFSTS
jgi:4,5-DOPA dioxygenase extradiol